MKRFWSIVKWVLLIWGTITALGAILVVGVVVYQTTIGNQASHDDANKKDVRFVLNWCRLGEERIEAVLHSYQSSRSFTGDHVDAYAIKISHVDQSELQSDGWVRVDHASGVSKDAIDFMAMWLGDEIAWFPEIEEIRSDKYFIYLWRIVFHGNGRD